MAKVFLDAGDDFRIVNDNTLVYGVVGEESVIIEEGTTGVIINGNVDRVDFAGNIEDFTFKAGFGANTLVYAADGITLLATISLQDDPTGTIPGTQLVFADGAITSSFAGGINTTGGVERSFDAAAVPAAIVPDPADIDEDVITEADITPVVTAPTFSVAASAASVTEGDAGNITATFTVTLSSAPGAGEEVTVDYDTADGAATAGEDYEAVTGTLIFAEGETTKTIEVTVTGDTIVEEDEAFQMLLSNVAGTIGGKAAVISDATGVGTIVDDDESSVSGETFTLTTGDDILEGTDGDDHFYGIYDGVTFLAQNTFNSGDILDGAGGTDTLHINHFEDVAIDLPDTLWTGISGIENIVMNTTGSGAHDIITGTTFNTAFALDGVNLSTTTTGPGAITINMSSFTGTAKLTANSAAGAIAVSGVNFTQIDVTTTGAGAQTITSTGAVNVIVNATSNEGATSITTGAGGDTISLHATSAGGLNTITAGAGADTINLYNNFASIDTIVQTDGDSMASTANTTTDNIAAGQTITFGNGLDIISNFGSNDILNLGTGGAAVSGLTMNEALFAATKTIFFSGTYAGNIFTIAADGGGTDTLLLDTTAVGDTDIATADTWILLQGVTSDALSAGTFI